MMKYIILLILSLTISFSFGQDIKGRIIEKNDGKSDPLIGVNVYWENTQIGTVSNNKGEYSIPENKKSNTLIFSYVGYNNDTVKVGNRTRINVELKESQLLGEVEVGERREATTIDRLDPKLTQNISGAAFHRAACCNLSESFETNATVDVSYADAVTGSKQIKMLGLDGKYVQMQMENIPIMSGLASSYGLTYIPGPWMESIQVSKGASSVKNGYSSVTGQINAEYKKPDNSDRLFLNVVANDALGGEFNFNSATKIGKYWSTLIAGHFHNNQTQHDRNKDGFLDQPLITRYQALNRWKYKGDKFIMQFGGLFLKEDRLGGQTSYNRDNESSLGNGYAIGIKSDRVELFAKGGYIFEKNSDFSVAFITNGAYHNHESFYGLTTYNASEKSFNGSLLLEGIIGTVKNRFSTGLSYKYNNIEENLNDSINNRQEIVPGAYFEYTYAPTNTLTFMAGIRGDYHNEFGFFSTPRMHAKYNLSEKDVFRASAGLGYRTAHVLIENSYLLANGAPIIFNESPEMEQAANYGISYIRHMTVSGRSWTFMADYYRTDFINQLIIDREDNQMVSIYNLDGQSYSNAFQVELQAKVIKRFDVTLAFRYNDVKATFNNELMEMPLVNRYKGLIALSYATNLKKWQFDVNTQINGDGRLPGSKQDGIRDYPAYVVLNAQVTKFFKRWSIYLGSENLTDYVQDNPILNADKPFSNEFNASQVWGPIHGRKIYMGLRFNINKK